MCKNHSIVKNKDVWVFSIESQSIDLDGSWTSVISYATGDAGSPQTRQLQEICCFSVTKLYLTLCDPMDCSTPSFPVPHYLLEFAQVHVHWISDAIKPSRPLPLSSPAFSLSQHQGLLQWVSSSHQMAKVLELQHQSFQWIFRVDFLRIDWLASLYPARLSLCEDVFYTHEWQVGPVY